MFMVKPDLTLPTMFSASEARSSPIFAVILAFLTLFQVCEVVGDGGA